MARTRKRHDHAPLIQPRPFNYDDWIATETETIASTCNRLAMGGVFSAKVYFVPGSRSLVASHKPVPFETLKLANWGENVMAVPRPALRSVLWHACRNLPIIPVEVTP